jgi:hypothetical protein
MSLNREVSHAILKVEDGFGLGVQVRLRVVETDIGTASHRLRLVCARIFRNSKEYAGRLQQAITGIRDSSPYRWIPGAIDSRHDLVDRCSLKPTMAVAGVVAGARPIEAEKSGQSVKAQFPLENREGVSLEVHVAHFVRWRHFSNSLYQDSGFSALTRSASL